MQVHRLQTQLRVAFFQHCHLQNFLYLVAHSHAFILDHAAVSHQPLLIADGIGSQKRITRQEHGRNRCLKLMSHVVDEVNQPSRKASLMNNNPDRIHETERDHRDEQHRQEKQWPHLLPDIDLPIREVHIQVALRPKHVAGKQLSNKLARTQGRFIGGVTDEMKRIIGYRRHCILRLNIDS